MPGAFEAQQVGQRQEIADIVANIIAESTPFTSMLRKESKPNQKKCDFQVETYPDAPLTGVMDGADVESFDHVPRFELTAMMQKFRRPWSVSDFAAETTVAGLPKGEKGRQKAAAATILKFMMEGRFLCNADCTVDNGTVIPNETRGVFSWLQIAAQALYPVDAAFRPTAAVRHDAPLDELTETVFGAMMDEAYNLRREKGTLDGYVGTALKRIFDNWTVYANAGANNETFPVRQWNLKAESKVLINCVDFLKFSTGDVRLHLSSYLHLVEATGARQAESSRSGVFLNNRMWSLAHMRRPGMYELPNLGGGPRGYSDAICGTKCYNPLGQLVVETALDT